MIEALGGIAIEELNVPEIDPSNSYATPEGPETQSAGLPTEPLLDTDAETDDDKPSGEQLGRRDLQAK